MNFVTAVAYHLSLALPAALTQPCAEPCIPEDDATILLLVGAADGGGGEERRHHLLQRPGAPGEAGVLERAVEK